MKQDAFAQSSLASTGVAIVGMAGRFPGAADVEALWRNLRDGVESISRFTDAELEDSFDRSIRDDPNFVRARAILDGVELFDAGFFGMRPREAALTDPQHRLFLECAWQALEDAGYDPAAYSGAIGVFAGASISTYFLRHVCQDHAAAELFASEYQIGGYQELIGSLQDFLATRVSYKLDLRGPSVTVQSACSTALVAVSQACQSLLMYQSDMALAGGVSVSLPQRRGYLAQDGAMGSPQGRCRTFDAKADGTVFGGGAGAVLLKRLEDALADGDHIYAVIRGSAVNNDGAAKAGFTAPSANGQAQAVAAALADADVDPRTIGYVECHGTATPLGDPIEVAGLTKAFRSGTDDIGFCALGSIKPNIGHLDAASGVAGLIKTALALREAKLPPTLFFETPNPHIAFEGGPFYVNKEWRDWPREAWPRRAGVSSFGLGGTNAHVVLEEAPVAAPEPSLRPSQTLVVSARSEAALEAARKGLAQHLETHPEQPLADVAYTLQVGRRAFAHRAACVGRDRSELIASLASGQGLISGRAGERAPAVAFMFPGQGAQYPGMGSGLFETEPAFRADMRRSAEILRPLLGRDLCALLYGGPEERLDAETLLETQFAQPALFAVGHALAALWRSWGVEPRMMIGHSVGEFVAACLAGVFSQEDALALIAARGRLMQDTPPGSMLAVRLPEAELAPLLGESLALAAVNGPSLCVAAGPHEAVAELEAVLAGRDVMSRRLHTSHAFHTPMMETAAKALEERVAGVRLGAPRIRCVSSVTGDWLTEAQAVSPAYWAGHCREPVRFGDGLATLLRDGATEGQAPVLVEAGPGIVLSTFARQAGAGGEAGAVLASLPDASQPADDCDVMARSASRLWCAGVAIDWANAHAGERRRRVSLPTYPFERSRHWIDAPPASRKDASAPAQPDPVEPEPNFESTSVEIVSVMQAAPVAPVRSDAAPAEDLRIAEAQSRVVALLEKLSGDSLAGIAPDANFLEMGFDSLFLSQAAQQLAREFKVKLTFRQLLGELTTIPALAAFLAETLPPTPAPAVAQLPAVSSVPASTVSVPASSLSAFAPAPRAERASAAVGTVEQVIREQLDVMSRLMAQQLEALRGSDAAALAAPVPHAPVSGTPRAAPVPAAPGPARLEPSSAATVSGQGKSRFEMVAEARNAPAAAMTEAQNRTLEALTERFNARTPKSKVMAARHRPTLADPRAAAGFRQEWKDLVYPIVGERASGSRLWDVDGNVYIDLVNGYGQTMFGHSPPFVIEAVEAQMQKGFPIGPQAELAGRVAELFSEFTGDERVTFCNTGSEAVMAAMRVARTVTGRSRIVTFIGDYHGQFDEVLVKGSLRDGVARPLAAAAGIPQESVENMVVLPYGAPESLDWIRSHADELAAVLVEPVQSRHPDLQPAAFVREIRAITEAAGAALIIDEVITGFRMHPGGMQALFGVRADLATYGKIIGGGLPIGVLAGKAQFMDALDGGMWRYGDESYPEAGVTFFAGTFVRHPLVLAAMWAVLNHLKEKGPALQEGLNARTAALVRRLNDLFQRRGVDVHIETCGSLFFFNLATVSRFSGLFYPHMLERGVYIQDHYPCFLTTAHSDADIEAIAEAFESSLIAMQNAGFLPGGSPSGGPGGGVLPAPVLDESALEAPLTEAQSEVWLAAQLSDEASCAFNESVTLRLRGALDRVALARALNQVVARHQALRATFAPTGEAIRIAPSLEIAVRECDFELKPVEARERAWRELLAAEAETPFDLVNGPLIRAALVRWGPQEHALVVTAHHIVCDGWSTNVIISELAALYNAARSGAAADLPAPVGFVRYGAEERAQQSEAGGTAVESFWLRQFSAPPPPLDLPTDRPRRALQTFRGATLSRRLDGERTLAFRKAAARQGCTLFAALLAGYELLLGRLAGQEEVVVGIPAAGQALVEDGNLIGHCVSFLPLRGQWSGATTLADHFSATRRLMLEAFENQSFTLGTLVRKLALPRGAGHRPLVEAAFNLERLGDGIRMEGLKVEVDPNPKHFVNFDIFFNLTEQENGIRLDCDYNTDLFDAETIERWIGYYGVLLDSITRDIHETQGALTLSKLQLMTESERAELIAASRGPSVGPLDARPIHEIFAAEAARAPEAVAALCDDARVTYGELDRRANRLARRLQALGVRPGDRVGLLSQRSIEAITALLAILKAGGAYVPLDPSYPTDLLAFMLKDCAPALTLAQGDLAHALDGGELAFVDLETALQESADETDAPLDVARSSDDLAYIMYTSGSTGRPKGVMVPHRGVVRLTRGQNYASFGADETFLHLAPLAFDATTFEIWGALLNGARLAIVPEPRPSLDEIGEAIARHGATTAWFTAGLFHELVDHNLGALRPLRQILAGGDVLSPAHIEKALAGLPGVQLINGYGPTENTTFTCCYRIPGEGLGGGAVPIGTPIAHTDVYILGPELELAPPGSVGQICAGGDGLALGYLNRDELTREKFIPSPLGGGERLYLTGDMARRRRDGALEFFGRKDRQVKINGKRVELEEIENVLRADSRLADAVVVREDGGTRRMVAYLKLADQGLKIDADAIAKSALAALRVKLPEHMVPSLAVTLDALPLTPNGKVDRDRLPRPDGRAISLGLATSPAASEIELKLAEIWRDALEVDEIDRNSNFFELGGHSLLAVRMVARVAAAFGVKLRIGALFEAPTLAEFAKLVSRFEKRVAPSSVVSIQPEGSKTPIIAIHNTLMYYKLAKMLGDRPFFGIKLFDEGEARLPSGGMTEVAAEYVRVIRAAQPRGPYILIGLCVAGVIAYEAARQLREQGELVPLVVMADTVRPDYERNLPLGRKLLLGVAEHLHVFRHRVGLVASGRASLAKVLSFYTLVRKSRILDLLAKFGVIHPSQIGNDDWETWRLLTLLDAAQSGFRPVPSSDDIVLLRSDEILDDLLDIDLGWKDLAKGRLCSYRISGWHEEIFQNEQGIAQIAAVLRPLLEGVDAGRGPSGSVARAKPAGPIQPSDPSAPREASPAIARTFSAKDDAMRSVIASV
ncbi:hybrid non-ribosomal peptide synthetase/type I polyketide synthase [Methylocapsa acidiphila]|uniref:hybrid non-ribosomal peptide synthetase/type I polyketide synthase n=1 Tax=Methylocapsa acidiphila TaxID=133552 RepID=UPI00040C0A6D|nr:hybrid non-ribosomal peptide synthetase/type I polyketide synthase [Methylocapsa acidiphila]